MGSQPWQGSKGHQEPFLRQFYAQSAAGVSYQERVSTLTDKQSSWDDASWWDDSSWWDSASWCDQSTGSGGSTDGSQWQGSWQGWTSGGWQGNNTWGTVPRPTSAPIDRQSPMTVPMPLPIGHPQRMPVPNGQHHRLPVPLPIGHPQRLPVPLRVVQPQMLQPVLQGQPQMVMPNGMTFTQMVMSSTLPIVQPGPVWIAPQIEPQNTPSIMTSLVSALEVQGRVFGLDSSSQLEPTGLQAQADVKDDDAMSDVSPASVTNLLQAVPDEPAPSPQDVYDPFKEEPLPSPIVEYDDDGNVAHPPAPIMEAEIHEEDKQAAPAASVFDLLQDMPVVPDAVHEEVVPDAMHEEVVPDASELPEEVVPNAFELPEAGPATTESLLAAMDQWVTAANSMVPETKSVAKVRSTSTRSRSRGL